MAYLEEINFSFEGQQGFFPGRSTMTALNDAVDFIADHIDSERTVVNTFLDLSKAFYVLDHDQVLAKLKGLGRSGTVLDWFSSYLSGREQLTCRVSSHFRSGRYGSWLD
ncbi:uncharacterized protein LOC124372897 [Homalodisca vitripennis]|uniref:uncharacterized protein LOC124372897 n=1 Tax=Homalodisca vitripennis TaxID=197043 RepID=UPI001EEB8F07|nr:uncharacterized protein LOC124372897 [Homalodisca vitripennis]